MESRPLLTSFQIGGSAGDALPSHENAPSPPQTAQYRLLADYSNIVGHSGDVVKSAVPVRNIFA